jgi:hypothetical protein
MSLARAISHLMAWNLKPPPDGVAAEQDAAPGAVTPPEPDGLGNQGCRFYNALSLVT